jgi:hypothetical protein
VPDGQFTVVPPDTFVQGVKETFNTVVLGAAAVPVPLSVTLCCEPGTPPVSSVNTTLALRAPIARGLKVTCTLHMLPEAKVAGAIGQFTFVTPKSAGFIPAGAMLLMVKGPVPLLVAVIVCEVLTVPTVWLA